MSTNYLESQIINGVLRHGPEILSKIVADNKSVSAYLDRITLEKLNYPKPLSHIDSTIWYLPTSYQSMDIEEFLINQCPEENYDRLLMELEIYRKKDMFPILKTMKYIVDTLRENNIVWGVGRGSSVASYVLFLLGVHKVDSVKYKLPIEEFFKGE